LRTRFSKSLLALGWTLLALARAETYTEQIENLDLTPYIGASGTDLFNAVGPRNVAVWVYNTYAFFVSTGLGDLITLVGTGLLAIAIVNLGNQMILGGGYVAARAGLMRVAFVTVALALLSPTSGGIERLLSLWASAYNTSAGATYVTDLSNRYSELASEVVVNTGKWVASGALINTAGSSLRVASEIGGAVSKVSIVTILISGAGQELGALAESVGRSILNMATFSLYAFLGLALVYSLFLILSGFAWALGAFLLPLGLGLYLFQPTQRVLSSILSFMLAGLVFTLLLPVILTIVLQTIVVPSMEEMNSEVAAASAQAAVDAQYTRYLMDEIHRATESCLYVDGGALVNRLAPPPLMKTGSVNYDGHLYTFQYPAYDPARCIPLAEPQPYTQGAIADQLNAYFNPGSLDPPQALADNNAATAAVKVLVSAIASGIVGTLAFFLFIGAIRILGQLLGAVGFGSAVENPIT